MAADSAAMNVLFHGVRGSAPAPGADFAEYGGDTPSIEIAADDRRVFIDAGSGLKNFKPKADDGSEYDLILSHYHADHLIGLSFFAPLWIPGGRLRIWAPRFPGVDPDSALRSFFAPPYAPVALHAAPKRVEIRAFTPGDAWRIEGVFEISTSIQNHPGGSCAIAVAHGGARAVYASDAEFRSEADIDKISGFARAANLFIVDAMWTPQEADLRRGWGHSSYRDAIAAAAAAAVEKTALFHHDSSRTDAQLRLLDAEAARLREGAFFARQGMTIALDSAMLDASA